MEFSLTLRSYNCFGGHPVLSFIPAFLLEGAGGFGPAVNEIEMTFLLAHPGPPRKTLEGMFAEFEALRRKPPRITFRRSRDKVEIIHSTEVMDAIERDGRAAISPARFDQTAREVVQALALLKRSVKKADAFDVDAFLAHCTGRLARTPKSDLELATLIDALREQKAKRLTAMSPWEKLGIDWRDYHPQARQLLDDPFYWDAVDDFAPHGNDTGADILHGYREWFERDRGASDPLVFYHAQVASWHKPDGSLPEILHEPLNEAAVGVAFAEIKLRAACRPSIRVLAKRAIARQRANAEAARDWEFRQQRLSRLHQLEAKLDSVPST